jgi:hypothetical protein
MGKDYWYQYPWNQTILSAPNLFNSEEWLNSFPDNAEISVESKGIMWYSNGSDNYFRIL